MHPNETAIHDYVAGGLGPPDSSEITIDAAGRAEVERHLASCAECRALVADLREIRRVAGSLDLREPPVRAWGRIERAIRLEGEHSAERASGLQSLLRSKATWTWMAAAAVLVLAVVTGVRYTPRSTTTGTPATQCNGANVQAGGDAAHVEAELRQAAAHYENAIKGLEQIANAEQGELDPRTAATLQKNLSVIDQAISESRAALRAEPTSEPAQQSLIDSFKTKMALLQDTVALINEMRKGNEAGAARIVSGLKPKG
jgi:anti-sigma factor RsiW